MAVLEVLNPVAEIVHAKVEAARRPDSLGSKRVGLFWNNKPGGDIALAAISEELAQRYPTTTFRNYIASMGSSTRYMTPGDRELISSECDVVIGTTAD